MSKDERGQAKLAMTMAEDRRVDFGTFLRQAREQRGVTLQELAVTTKISARVLESLERNDPGKLPGGIFSRAFVRAYAREVGVDPEAAVARFVEAFPEASGVEDMPSAASAVEAESLEQGRRSVKIAAGVIGVAALVAVAGFLYYSNVRPAAQPDPPAAVQPPAVNAPAPAPAAPQNESPAPATPAFSGVAQEAAADSAAREVPVPPPVEPEPVPPPAAPAEFVAETGARPASAPSPQLPLVVVLTATGNCWLSISVDGTRVPSRTLQAGERVEFAVQRSMTMTAGNAGALAITLNGKPARPLGAAAQVVTTTITAAGYEALLR
jgi:cytoskeleton protein RodZ